MDYTVRPRWGVGALRLGMTRAEVRALLGAPDSEENEEIEGFPAWTWHYPREALSAFFSAEYEERLWLVIVRSPAALVCGVRPIGLSEAEVRERLAGIDELVLRDTLPEAGIRMFDLARSDVGLLFSDGVCDQIDVSVHIDEDDACEWPRADALQ